MESILVEKYNNIQQRIVLKKKSLNKQYLDRLYFKNKVQQHIWVDVCIYAFILPTAVLKLQKKKKKQVGEKQFALYARGGDVVTQLA